MVVGSLIVFRFTQISNATLTGYDWFLLVPVGTLSFVVGSKWLFERVSLLSRFREFWSISCLGYIFVWLLHASQADIALSQSPVGQAFASFTLHYSSLLLSLSGVHPVVTGEVISMGPLSRVGEIAVTPLCSGFLSCVLFAAGFSVVLLDVGRVLGGVRLAIAFGLGVAGTFAISGLRVFLVLITGYFWGWGALAVAHAYLGYVLFLSLISLFWYLTLDWCKRIQERRTAAPVGVIPSNP